MSEPLHDRDYLERTIATIRIHRDADNCWPQWANILADEIERLWAVEADLASIARETEAIIRDGGSPSPEAFAYLSAVRNRHVEQIKALEAKLGLAVSGASAASDPKEEA
jgi:hypothetical protein